jgi:hypothetical protein
MKNVEIISTMPIDDALADLPDVEIEEVEETLIYPKDFSERDFYLLIKNNMYDACRSPADNSNMVFQQEKRIRQCQIYKANNCESIDKYQTSIGYVIIKCPLFEKCMSSDERKQGDNNINNEIGETLGNIYRQVRIP